PDASSHVPPVVDVVLPLGIEETEAQGERGIAEPGIGEGELEARAFPSPFQVQVDRLTVAEQVVVAELDESGEAGAAREAGSRARRSGLLLLHLQRQLDIGAVARRLVVDRHVLEEAEGEDVPLRAHERGAPEGVPWPDRRL